MSVSTTSPDLRLPARKLSLGTRALRRTVAAGLERRRRSASVGEGQEVRDVECVAHKPIAWALAVKKMPLGFAASRVARRS